MRIHFERTGGVAGMRVAYDVDSDRLPPDEQQHLARLVGASRFFEFDDGRSADDTGADRFEYSISIDDGSGGRTVRVAEPVPAMLRPLITWLTTRARR